MTVPTFDAQRAAWARIPVDDVGYLPASELLVLRDDDLLDLVNRMENTRYTGWRNHAGLWRDALGLDRTRDATVLDYGCGVGVEALQYARAGNQIWVADVNAATVALAKRVLWLHGYPALNLTLDSDPPWSDDDDPLGESFDVIHCAGVLHHITEPRPVVESLARWLRPGGELRLMVYSDAAWRLTTGTEPPDDVRDHPARETFVRAMDEVGDWADWYDRDRLWARFGRWLDVETVTYLTPDRRYLAATLRRPR